MPYSYVSYPTDGTVQVFSVTMPYLEREHIYVWVDGVEDTEFTWETDTTIRLSEMPPADVFVTIRRMTPYASLSTDFEDSSLLDEETLDNAMAELFYIMQESVEESSTVLSKDIATNNWDFEEGVLSNVADPLVDTDAVTLGYLNDNWKTSLDAILASANSLYSGQIVPARDTTEGYRDQAEGYKDQAEAARDAALAIDLHAVQTYNDVDTSAAILPKGTTAQRPNVPDTSHIRYNTELERYEVYKDSSWEEVSLTSEMADATIARTGATGAAELPAGTTAQRPTDAAGLLRFNSETTEFEGNYGSEWETISKGWRLTELWDGTTTPANYGDTIDWASKGLTYDGFDFIMVIAEVTGFAGARAAAETVIISTSAIDMCIQPVFRLAQGSNDTWSTYIKANIAFDTTTKTDALIDGRQSDPAYDVNVYKVYGVKI